MKNLTIIVCAFASFLWSSYCLALQPGEGITTDSVTGNYIFSYRGDGGQATDPLRQLTFIPSTKIYPTLTSIFNLAVSGNIHYEYTVANGTNATQSICDLDVYGLPASINIPIESSFSSGSRQVDVFKSSLSVPNSNWYANGERSLGDAARFGWTYSAKAKHTQPLPCIQPGTVQNGFGISGFDLPGLVIAQVRGNGSLSIAFPDDGPSGEMEALYYQLQDNNFVPRNAAAPMIAVPTPYDAAVTLENIQTHVHTWIAKQLLNATFSSQLDTSFQAAIAAYRANQPQTAIIQLQTMRTLIKQQQPDADKNDVTPTINLPAPPALIDLLAARILYFDLGYVMQR
jgi:hypothetical protein